MSPLGWIFMLLLPASCAHGFKSLVDYLNANISQEWNEDLEPVLESLTKRLRMELFPVVQEILYDEEIPVRCLQSLVRLTSGLNDRRLWAMRFLDSIGRPSAGAMAGHVTALGNYDECLEIRVPDRNDPGKVAFGGQYCTVSVSVRRQPWMYRILPEMVMQDPVFSNFIGDPNATWILDLAERAPLGFRMGICLPSTCDSSLVTHLAEKFGGKYGIRADILACRDQLSGESLPIGTVIAGIVVGTMIVLVVAGTLVHSYCDEELGVVKFFRCFSARTAYTSITSTAIAPAVRHLDCIHGIRVLSSFWILYAHTFGGDPGNFDNLRKAMVSMRSPLFSLITQGMLAVETFFALTGILLYTSVAAESRKTEFPTPKFALMIIMRRACRLLVPSLGALCMFYLFPLITSGPGFDAGYPFFKNNCDERWWSIPLFINNLWSLEHACVGNQWYNAVDMQCLCILLLPLLLMLRKPAEGIFIVLTLIGLSVVGTAALTLHHGAFPAALVLPRNTIGALHFILRIHDRCLPHLSSVAVGLIGGYLIENHRDSKLSRSFTRIAWILFVVLINSIVFVVHLWHERGSITTLESLLYGGFYRPLWSLCIVWLVFMCSAGRAERLRWLLSRQNFIPLSRLSFCFYLMQLQVVMMKNFTARSIVPFTYYQNLRDFFADLAFNYMAAWVLVVLFEAPAAALDKLINGLMLQREPSKLSEEKMKRICVTKIDDASAISYKL